MGAALVAPAHCKQGKALELSVPKISNKYEIGLTVPSSFKHMEVLNGSDHE